MNNPAHKATTMTYSELVRLAMSIEKNGEPTLGKVPNEEVVFSVDFSPDEYNDWTYEDALQLYKSILKVARLHEIGAHLEEKHKQRHVDSNVEEDYKLLLDQTAEHKKSKDVEKAEDRGVTDEISISSSQEQILQHSIGKGSEDHVYISASEKREYHQLPPEYEITSNMRHPIIGDESSGEETTQQNTDAFAVLEEGDVNYYLSKHRPPDIQLPLDKSLGEEISSVVEKVEKSVEKNLDTYQLRQQMIDLTNQLFNTSNESERKRIRDQIRTIQLILKTKNIGKDTLKEEKEANILLEEERKQLTQIKNNIINAWRSALIKTLEEYLQVLSNAKEEEFSKIRTVFMNDIHSLSERCENIIAVYNQHLTTSTSNMWNEILSKLKQKDKEKYRAIEEKRKEEYRDIARQLKTLKEALVGLTNEIGSKDHLFAEECLELLKTDDEKIIDYAHEHFPQLHVEFKKGKISKNELVLQTILRMLKEWEVKHGS